MTVTAILSVSPVIEESMAPHIADAIDALEDFEVSYETNAMGTIIEAEQASEVFKAAAAAHEAVETDRVSTVLKIDDKRAVTESAQAKVEAVESHLGRAAHGNGGS